MICGPCAQGADMISLAIGGEMTGEHLYRDGARLHARCRSSSNPAPGQLPSCACQHRVPAKLG